jgi:hypothetical protein
MEDFGLWIDSIDDFVADFLAVLPLEVGIKLTYSLETLKLVES